MQIENLHPLVIPEEDVMIFSGKVIAENASYDDYLSGKYGTHVEWVYGVVIALSPVTPEYSDLNQFVDFLFKTMLDLTTGGKVFRDPMVMKLGPDFPARQPDIQVLLPDRIHFIKKAQVAGPANLVVEIVSPESSKRDRGDKYDEYEKGGVDEYWILDQLRKESLFYVRGEDGLYHTRQPIEGVYTSHVLPKLKLHIDLFWQEKLPTTVEIVRMVEAMLKESD